MKPISRNSGRSAVAAAAYRSASKLKNYENGMVHDFRRKKGVVHTEIILPGGSQADWAKEREKLWNVAEATDKRKNARTAREIEIALPVELTPTQRVELVQEFSQHLADKYDVAVDVAIHTPEAKGADSRNHHAHLLLTTRTIDLEEKLGEKTNFEKSDTWLTDRNLPTTTKQLENIREQWAECTNMHLAKAGHEIRIDSRSHYERGLELVPTQHVGVHATQIKRRGQSVFRKTLSLEESNENRITISNDPTQVLNLIAVDKSVFTKADVARCIRRYVAEEDFQKIFERVMDSPELVALQESQPSTDNTILPRYSTRQTIEIESGIIKTAEKLRNSKQHHTEHTYLNQAINRQELKNPDMILSDDQIRAVDHITGMGRLKTVTGYAGAGKSTMLTVALDAWKTSGSRVIGATLSGKAAIGLEQSSGIKTQTIASLFKDWESGRSQLGKNDVLVVDEAGMINNDQLSQIISKVDSQGAKLVLVGDPGQLQSIGSGAGFRAIVNQIGGVKLTEVHRQYNTWQRQATKDFAELRSEQALVAYMDNGKILQVNDKKDQKESYKSLASDYVFNPKKNQTETRLGLTYQKKDVQMLNSAIRCLRKEFSEIGEGRYIKTENGLKEFAPGDRITLLKNDRKLGVQNGSLATVQRVNQKNLVIQLDESERSISIPVNQYNSFDYGYATTIHKSQGATVDKTFVLASKAMDRHTSYVAMTRHRDDAKIYVSTSRFKNTIECISSLSKSGLNETTHDFDHSFSLNRGIGVSPSPSSSQKEKSQSKDIIFEIDSGGRSKRDNEKSKVIEDENIPLNFPQPSNNLPAPKYKLQETLDNFASVYEQICWRKSFDLVITPEQTNLLRMAETNIEKIDSTTFKKLKSIKPEILESIITKTSGVERTDTLTECIQNTLIQSNNLTIKPKPTPQRDDKKDYAYRYPAPRPRF